MTTPEVPQARDSGLLCPVDMIHNNVEKSPMAWRAVHDPARC